MSAVDKTCCEIAGFNCSQGKTCPYRLKSANDGKPYAHDSVTDWISDMATSAWRVVIGVLAAVLAIPFVVHLLFNLFHRTT